jgi:hypothetical protein
MSTLGRQIMAEHQMMLTAEEHDFLRRLLEEALKETRIEEHRTRKLSYREYVLQKENLLIGLLDKLQQPVGS